MSYGDIGLSEMSTKFDNPIAGISGQHASTPFPMTFMMPALVFLRMPQKPAARMIRRRTPSSTRS